MFQGKKGKKGNILLEKSAQELKVEVRYIMSQHGGNLQAQGVAKDTGSPYIPVASSLRIPRAHHKRVSRAHPGYGKEACRPLWWPKTYFFSAKGLDVEMPWHVEDSKPGRMNKEQVGKAPGDLLSL